MPATLRRRHGAVSGGCAGRQNAALNPSSCAAGEGRRWGSGEGTQASADGADTGPCSLPSRPLSPGGRNAAGWITFRKVLPPTPTLRLYPPTTGEHTTSISLTTRETHKDQESSQPAGSTQKAPAVFLLLGTHGSSSGAFSDLTWARAAPPLLSGRRDPQNAGPTTGLLMQQVWGGSESTSSPARWCCWAGTAL